MPDTLKYIEQLIEQEESYLRGYEEEGEKKPKFSLDSLKELKEIQVELSTKKDTAALIQKWQDKHTELLSDYNKITGENIVFKQEMRTRMTDMLEIIDDLKQL